MLIKLEERREEKEKKSWLVATPCEAKLKLCAHLEKTSYGILQQSAACAGPSNIYEAFRLWTVLYSDESTFNAAASAADPSSNPRSLAHSGPIHFYGGDTFLRTGEAEAREYDGGERRRNETGAGKKRRRRRRLFH